MISSENAKEARRRISVASTTLVLVLFVCAVIAGLETSRTLEQRAEALATGKRDTANLAMSLTQHADLTFRAADAVLAGLVERLETQDFQGPERATELRRWFHDEIERLPQVRSFAVSDPNGLIFISSDSDGPNVGVADREYFRFHLERNRRELFIGPPIRLESRWVIPVSRRYNKINGSFGGVATAFLDPDFFQKFYEQFDVGAHGSILLVSDHARLLVRRPFVEANIGRDMSQGNIAKALQHAPVDTVEIRAMTDGVVRLNSYRRSEAYPLIISVARATDEILSPWRSRTIREVMETSILLLTILLAGFVVWKMTRQLSANAAQLTQANQRFEIAINNMPHGICLFDADQRVVVFNRRYAEIYHLDSQDVQPGTTLREILEARTRKGTHFHFNADEYIDRNLKKRTDIQELADGRVVAITRQPMPNGGWLTTHEDITDRQKNERQIAYLAAHDQLTGLPNRTNFLRTLDNVTSRSEAIAIFLVDLDRFKAVNDTLGHAAGDQLLKEVAIRLTSAIREHDVVARLGGDEFAIIQRLGNGRHEAPISLALRIIDLISQPFELDDHTISVGTSIGIALCPEQGTDRADLLKKADLALYSVKAAGRNDFRIYDTEISKVAESQKLLESELRQAIDREEFELYYQPILDVRTQAVRGAEALVRWNHPKRGVIPPGQFIPLAEETGLIIPLGEWIIQQGCRDAAAWLENLSVAINLSAHQFNKGNLFDVVLCALLESGLNPERLELEITESALLDNQSEHLQTLRQLKNIGITIVLDDFGTGYSSARYLTLYPFDKIKIDRSFVHGMTTQRECSAVVASIIALARGLEIAITAEGVETYEQLNLLSVSGVDFVQGYLIGHPMTLADFQNKAWQLPSRIVA